MPVNTQHAAYGAMSAQWALVRDVCAGAKAVKDQGVAYLPMPNASDTSKDNLSRYDQYLERALFLEVTKTTKQGLIGAAFRHNPSFDAQGLEYLTDNADGMGNSIYQQAQMVLSEQLAQGRCGLLVDYPATTVDTSLADRQSGVRATIALYAASSIINWRHAAIGGQSKLSLVVLSELVDDIDELDVFNVKQVQQYRVLRLVDGVYTVEVWRDDHLFGEPFTPTQANGQTFNEIPFTFVGAVNNDSSVDPIPLEPLARVNVAHYRNSADYEDSAYRVGQAQAWVTGLNEEWRDFLAKQGIKIGGPTALLLPQGGQFGFAQVGPNMLAKEAMSDKLNMMQMLGARLVEAGSASKTATQAGAEQNIQHSVLSLCVANLNEAYLKALAWCAAFMGSSEQIVFAVTQDFVDLSVDPHLLTELRNQNQAGLFPRSSVWAYLRKVGMIESNKTDDDLTGEIDAEMPSGGLNESGIT